MSLYTAPFVSLLAAFAADLTAKFATPLHFNPEDQLKAPMLTLLKGTAAAVFALLRKVLVAPVAAPYPMCEGIEVVDPLTAVAQIAG